MRQGRGSRERVAKEERGRKRGAVRRRSGAPWVEVVVNGGGSIYRGSGVEESLPLDSVPSGSSAPRSRPPGQGLRSFVTILHREQSRCGMPCALGRATIAPRLGRVTLLASPRTRTASAPEEQRFEPQAPQRGTPRPCATPSFEPKPSQRATPFPSANITDHTPAWG